MLGQVDPVTPAQIAVPIAVGLAVLVLVQLAQRVPDLPDWTVARGVAELDGETHRLAAKTLQSVQAQSFERNREYCGYLFRTENGLAASVPRRGSLDACTIDYPETGFGRVVASYHTHGGYEPEYDNEAPSVTDMRSTFADGLDDYIATPGGRLWHISSEYEAAMLICAEGCLASDADYVACPRDDAAISYRLSDIRARDRSREIVC